MKTTQSSKQAHSQEDHHRRASQKVGSMQRKMELENLTARESLDEAQSSKKEENEFLKLQSNQSYCMISTKTDRYENMTRQMHSFNTHLRVLDLSQNQLEWKELIHLIANNELLQNIQILDLSNNYLQDRGICILTDKNCS